jgi:hypothetical protein
VFTLYLFFLSCFNEICVVSVLNFVNIENP